jgi:hypothetical protein
MLDIRSLWTKVYLLLAAIGLLSCAFGFIFINKNPVLTSKIVVCCCLLLPFYIVASLLVADFKHAQNKYRSNPNPR